MIIETQRLILRQWKAKDKPIFAELNADPEVMTFFPSLLTISESDSFVDRCVAMIEKEGFGLFAVELKESGAFIGFIGLCPATFESDFTPCIEIGWRLHKQYWNRGYATEGAKKVLEFAFDTLGKTEIFSFTSLLNLPSISVMEKIGMEKVREFDHPKLLVDDALCRHVLYRVTSSVQP